MVNFMFSDEDQDLSNFGRDDFFNDGGSAISAWGIDRRMTEHLHAQGIRTVWDLAQADACSARRRSRGAGLGYVPGIDEPELYNAARSVVGSLLRRHGGTVFRRRRVLQ